MKYDWTPDELQSMNISEDLLAEQYILLADIFTTIANLHRTRAKAWLNVGKRQATDIKLETKELEKSNVSNKP